jgi:hypothetical protein
MHAGQAIVEYALLAFAVVLGLCLLARFATPVEAIGAAIVQALDQRERPPASGSRARPPRRLAGPAEPRRRTRAPRPCYCPLERADPARERPEPPPQAVDWPHDGRRPPGHERGFALVGDRHVRRAGAAGRLDDLDRPLGRPRARRRTPVGRVRSRGDPLGPRRL